MNFLITTIPFIFDFVRGNSTIFDKYIKTSLFRQYNYDVSTVKIRLVSFNKFTNDVFHNFEARTDKRQLRGQTSLES